MFCFLLVALCTELLAAVTELPVAPAAAPAAAPGAATAAAPAVASCECCLFRMTTCKAGI